MNISQAGLSVIVVLWLALLPCVEEVLGSIHVTANFAYNHVFEYIWYWRT